MKLTALLQAAAIVSVSTLSIPAYAQEFPTRAVTLVVPFAPGGSNDMLGRFVADQLAKRWGQPVVVENRPGAGSAIGAAFVSQAPADGYTMLIGSVTYSMNPAVQENMPFDSRTDLTPVAMLGNTPMVLTVSGTSEFKDFPSFLAKAKEGGLFYAGTGPGSVNQFAAELLNQSAGTKMEVVHFGGGSEAIVDVIGGHVDVFFSSVTQALPQINAGQLRPLAVTSPERNASLPDLMTMSELGVTDADVQQWWSILVPDGTPQPIIDKMNTDINEIMTSDAGVAFLAKDGGVPTPMSPAEVRDFVHSELDRWKAVADATGIKAE